MLTPASSNISRKGLLLIYYEAISFTKEDWSFNTPDNKGIWIMAYIFFSYYYHLREERYMGEAILEIALFIRSKQTLYYLSYFMLCNNFLDSYFILIHDFSTEI